MTELELKLLRELEQLEKVRDEERRSFMRLLDEISKQQTEILREQSRLISILSTPPKIENLEQFLQQQFAKLENKLEHSQQTIGSRIESALCSIRL